MVTITVYFSDNSSHRFPIEGDYHIEDEYIHQLMQRIITTGYYRCQGTTEGGVKAWTSPHCIEGVVATEVKR